MGELILLAVVLAVGGVLLWNKLAIDAFWNEYRAWKAWDNARYYKTMGRGK